MWREHKKLWKQRAVVVFVVAGLLLNLFLLLRSEYSRQSWMEPTVSCYRSIYHEIKGMEPAQAKSYLKKKSNNQNIAYERRIGYETMLDEISRAGSYDDYLEEREKDYSKSKVFEGFRKSSKYDREDAAKVMKMLRQFQGSTVQIVPSRGWAMILLFFQTDIVGLVTLLAAAAVSFMQEKERGEYFFIRTMKRGRESFIIYKVLALLLFTMEVMLLLYLENILVAWKMYGLGDLNACLQSVNGFIGTGVAADLKQSIVLFLGLKLLAYFMVMLLILFLMTVCGTSQKLYICLAVILGGSSLAYWGISANSWLSALKYVNLIGFLHTGEMMAVYRNIGLYGFPVSYITVGIVFFIVVGILLFTGTVFFFCDQKIVSRARRHILPKGKRQRKIRGYRLFYGETKKILYYQSVFLMVCVFAGVVWWNYTPVHSLYNDESDVYYKEYVDQVSGPYTKAFAKKIKQWREERLALEKQIHKEKRKAATDELKSIVESGYTKERKRTEGFQVLMDHLGYISGIPNGGLFYERGYEQLTGYEMAWKRDAMLALEGVLMVILTVAGIYSREYETGMMRLLRTTSRGRKELRSAKLWIGVGIVTVIYGIIYGSEFYRILSAFGTKGWSCSVASMSHMPLYLSGLAVVDYLALILVMRYLGFLLVMAAVYLISSRAESFIMTVVYSISIFALPLVLYLSGVKVLKYVLLNPLLLGNIF